MHMRSGGFYSLLIVTSHVLPSFSTLYIMHHHFWIAKIRSFLMSGLGHTFKKLSTVYSLEQFDKLYYSLLV